MNVIFARLTLSFTSYNNISQFFKIRGMLFNNISLLIRINYINIMYRTRTSTMKGGITLVI